MGFYLWRYVVWVGVAFAGDRRLNSFHHCDQYRERAILGKQRATIHTDERSADEFAGCLIRYPGLVADCVGRAKLVDISETGLNVMAERLFDEKTLRKLDRLTLVASRVRSGVMKGERRSNKRGTSIEFADYRNYAQGDDLRRVDWNIFARLDRPFIKLLEEEEDLAVH